MADDPHTDARADGDIDEVAEADRRSRLSFGQRGGDDVGGERRGDVGGERGDQVGILPTGLGRSEYPAITRITRIDRRSSPESILAPRNLVF